MLAEQPVIGSADVSYAAIAQVIIVAYWNVSSSSKYVFLLLRTKKVYYIALF